MPSRTRERPSYEAGTLPDIARCVVRPSPLRIGGDIEPSEVETVAVERLAPCVQAPASVEPELRLVHESMGELSCSDQGVAMAPCVRDESLVMFDSVTCIHEYLWTSVPSGDPDQGSGGKHGRHVARRFLRHEVVWQGGWRPRARWRCVYTCVCVCACS